MRLSNPAASAFDRRLDPASEAPIAVALSGGGDSLALLVRALAWARPRGREVHALCVDHGINPQSPSWTRFCGETAERLGARFLALNWAGPKPAAGLPAAARAARHALLADAAREIGARVVLTGHTADDVAEEAWMRARGSTLGRLREWAPSPAWPQGRGVFLFRPLLDRTRDSLRAELRSLGLCWIEDPANADLRYARSRAREALDGEPVHATPAGDPDPALWAATTEHGSEIMIDRRAFAAADRGAARAYLAAAVRCASGGAGPLRAAATDRIATALGAPEREISVVGGTRIEATQATVRLVREAGETARGGLRPLRLGRGAVAVWDGRFELETDEAGWSVLPARGSLAALDPADRKALKEFSPAARAVQPILVREGSARPVLAGRAARVRSLVGDRLRAASGAASCERAIGRGDVAPEGR